MTTTIRESTGTASKPSDGGRMLIQLITPGDGSSGVYPAPVLEAAGRAGVFPAGTLMFADHPSASAERDLPERSIRDVAGVLTENAYWDGTALVAEARTFEPWASVIAQMHDAIGVSIRASARVEETDQRGLPVIAELVEGLSVDFVTYPGRGGAIRQVYESAPAPGIRVVESLPGDLTATDLERRLDTAVGPDTYVEDHTDEWVVYARLEDGGRALYRQTYTADPDGRITLTGTPEPVARRVTYDALTLPSDQAGTTQESDTKEPSVATIQIDEADHKALTDRAGQVETLEAQRDTLTRERDTALAQLAEARKAADAATIDRVIGEAGVKFTALERAGLTADLPLDGDDRLDVPAFESRVREAAAEARAAMGEGRPAGVGTITESTDYTEDDYRRDLGITKEA